MNHDVLRFNQAQTLLNQNRPADALPIVQPLAVKFPTNASINSLLTLILLRLGRPDQALAPARRAAQAGGDDPLHLTNLGIVLAAAGLRQEGKDLLARVARANPAFQPARQMLADMEVDDSNFSEAASLCREALSIAWHPRIAACYADALIALCRNEEAAAFLKEAETHFPDDPELAAQLALSYKSQDATDPDEVAAAHRRYGAVADRIKPPFRASYAPTKDAVKKLRIGLVSPDLHQHSVAYFLEPFLEHFDRDQLEVVCYSTLRAHDSVSERLKAHSTLWREAWNLDDVQLAEMMSRDRIDIAVDLSGHTNGHRLLTFVLRAAPVQATYLGYTDTTGLMQMDYRIVDSLTDPPDPARDARCTESLLRLDPCFICYRPLGDAPPPSRDPAFPGPVFGSFNSVRKLMDPAIDLWARVLKAVPTSRLALKAQDLVEPARADRLRARLASQGVDPSRLDILEAPKGAVEHLKMYSRIDVALDTFPYNGTTTTCEALWMGVPVVALAGSRHAGRVGVTLLTNTGLPELIAATQDDYVNIAAALVQDPARLASYRTTLRNRIAVSPLCDRAAFAARLGLAFRTMWRQYCEGQGSPA